MGTIHTLKVPDELHLLRMDQLYGRQLHAEIAKLLEGLLPRAVSKAGEQLTVQIAPDGNIYGVPVRWINASFSARQRTCKYHFLTYLGEPLRCYTIPEVLPYMSAYERRLKLGKWDRESRVSEYHKSLLPKPKSEERDSEEFAR